MEITSIKIDGFANLDNIELEIEKFNTLVALNNFGKSNVINAIDFGIKFITASDSSRKSMMAYREVIPINKEIANRPFSFEIGLTLKLRGKKEQFINYGYTFEWIRDRKNTGQRITHEFLKVKEKNDRKFTTYMSRDTEGGKYLPSPTGRCDQSISIEPTELLLTKLKNFDTLFYQDIIKAINTINIIHVDTLQSPTYLFRTIEPSIIRTDYSLDIPRTSDTGYFLFSLMKKDQHFFEILKDSVQSLLPQIENFTPVEIDLKQQAKIRETDNIPLDFPEKFYDIIVKEKNNNQSTAISRISAGSQKLFFILAMTIAAEINRVPLITFEELENSIHPSLLQRLLMVLDNIATHTKILTTSHSPYFIKYLSLDRIRIGIPNAKGTAQFKAIKRSKFSKINALSIEHGVSIGDTIFDGLLECSYGEESEFLSEICD